MEKYIAGLAFAVFLIVLGMHFEIGDWLNNKQSIITASNAVGWVTGLSTAVLAVLTFFLARATANMARATSCPQVVASIEVNQWSVIHFDLVLQNTGNATAFDIRVEFANPPQLADGKQGDPFPFTKVSLLRPGQTLISFLADFENLEGATYVVNVSWKSRPNVFQREFLTYEIDMNSMEGVSFLGKSSPLIQIADEVKKIRNDWKSVASGNKKMVVDVYSQADRDAKRRELETWRDEMKRKREGKSK